MTGRTRFALCFFVLMFTALPPFAMAGTSAGLSMAPWGDRRQHLAAHVSTLFEQAGPTSDGEVGINLYHGDFRLRLYNPGMYKGVTGINNLTHGEFGLHPYLKNLRNVSIGADITHLNLQGSAPAIGPRLVDQSYALGFQLTHVSDLFDLGMVAGVGYSGSTPFIEGDSFYAKGSLIFDHHFNKQDSLAVVIDYNGNRTFLPDWPIPTIVYQHYEGDKLTWVLGLPVAAIHWKPTDRWTIDLSYTPIISINASAEYEFVKNWKLYASYKSVEYAFHRDGTQPNRRIFFQQRRAEAGIKWIPLPMIRLFAGAGYAFDQKFSTGWDLRNTADLLDLHDEPYVRFKATLYF